MPGQPLFIHPGQVFAAVDALRGDSCSPVSCPAIEPPGVVSAGLEDALGRLSLLALGLAGKLSEQLGTLGNAINQAAVDAVMVDGVVIGGPR